MNERTLIADLSKLLTKWEQSSGSPDFVDRNEWVRGVVYGIKAAIHLVNWHLSQPNIRN